MSPSALPRRPFAGLVLLLGLATGQSALATTVETAHGPVEVGDDPQRVVTLYEGALDAALASGVVPLGAVTTRGGDGVAGYIDDYLAAHHPEAELAIVGVVREINLEAVLAQRPDLILAPPQLADEQYALLSRIAPTVVPLSQGLDPQAWKAESRLYGQALGREAQLETALAEVESRANELAVALDEAEVSGDASLVRWMPQGPLVMSDQLFTTGLMQAAGLRVNDAGLIPGESAHSDPLSLENLGRVDSDWLFLATLNADGQEALEAARTSPAFARLEAVANDRVVAVDGQLWTSASGPLAAQAVLDDIEAALLPR
ncbi:iron-siderophore ABC transporter substrate-binding protein [Halomonas salifodinae]|uniref:iron-siderophore ABC transporter substrate-binding protein n=1 Tax=Halomonas salifodinae TaxID=438745 RepID=UPI0033A3173E